MGAACGKKTTPLMLMMLGVDTANAKKGAQLMLMMLGVGTACAKKQASWRS